MKSLLNMTPNDYIKVRRLNAAAAMIENGASRINDVCYAVGFNTPSYFAKCFKKQFGVLPADYMKRADISGSGSFCSINWLNYSILENRFSQLCDAGNSRKANNL